jgi:hypothetical protein
MPSSSTALSTSVWIIPYSNTLGGYGAEPMVFGKIWYANSSWSSPYLGMEICVVGSELWSGKLYISGVGLVAITPTSTLILNRAYLLSLTYDGNYIRLYQDGILVATSSNYSGAASSVGSGPWYSGKAPVGYPGHSFD